MRIEVNSTPEPPKQWPIGDDRVKHHLMLEMDGVKNGYPHGLRQRWDLEYQARYENFVAHHADRIVYLQDDLLKGLFEEVRAHQVRPVLQRVA